jgi:hypothetical protein
MEKGAWIPARKSPAVTIAATSVIAKRHQSERMLAMQIMIRARDKMLVRRGWQLFVFCTALAVLVGTNIGFRSNAAEGENRSVNNKAYVLILFLYDPKGNYQVVRAATYASDSNCNRSGKNVLAALGVNKDKIQNQNYMCLEADLPY